METTSAVRKLPKSVEMQNIKPLLPIDLVQVIYPICQNPAPIRLIFRLSARNSFQKNSAFTNVCRGSILMLCRVCL